MQPENLLLQYKTSDSEIKIADFGFAKVAETEHSLKTICGTPGYGEHWLSLGDFVLLQLTYTHICSNDPC
jgi:serine/threonine protein kinase